MAKKNKKSMVTSVMSDIMNDTTNEIPDQTKFAGELSGCVNSDNFGIGDALSMINSEQLEFKQEIKYDDCCDANNELKRLSKENSDLIDKIAEYINDIYELKKKNAYLQTSYDDSLIKISEVSFEVAVLKSQLIEYEKQAPSIKSNTNTPLPSSQKESTYVPYTKINKNGYNDWN